MRKQPPITIGKEEYKKRVERVQKLMREEGVDVIIAFSNATEPQYVRYLADFWPTFETAGVAVHVTAGATLLVGPESNERAEITAKLPAVKRMLAFRESTAPAYSNNTFFTFERLFAEYNTFATVKTIGIAGSNFIPLAIYREIETATHTVLGEDVAIIDGDRIVDRVRMVKSDIEVACLREAARITRVAMNHVLANIRVGMTCEEIKGLGISKLYEEGAEGEAFDLWVTCEEETKFAIARSSKQVLKKNDLVQIQLGAKYNGYSSTLGRALVVGEASFFQKELITSVIAAKKVVEEKLYVGEDSEAVAKAYREELVKQGHLGWMVYGPCHGIGMVECEPPWIEMGKSYRLENNMVFCIDIFLQNAATHRAVRYEDMVLITNEGREMLTDYHNDIIEIHL